MSLEKKDHTSLEYYYTFKAYKGKVNIIRVDRRAVTSEGKTEATNSFCKSHSWTTPWKVLEVPYSMAEGISSMLAPTGSE